MKTHRYQYLYLPVSRYINRLSPQSRLLLVAGKLILILLLIGFDITYATHQL